MPWLLSHLNLQLQQQRLPLQLPFALLLLLLNICLQQDIVLVTADNAESKAHIGDYFPALNEFSTHTVIRPQVQHGRTKRSLQGTLDATDGLHAPSLSLSYTHQGQRIQIELQRNDRLLPEAHFLRYQNASNQLEGDSGYVVRNFTKTDVDLCHYQGHIRGRPDSRVALATCDGALNGVVFDGQDTYFIHPHSNGSGRLQDDHYLLRHADILQQNATCGYDSHTDNHSPHEQSGMEHKQEQEQESEQEPEQELKQLKLPHRLDGGEIKRMLRRQRRHTDESQLIRGPYNADKYSSYVELVIVVDNKVYKHFGENTKRVHQHCKDLANIINALYVPLNIFVALVGVVIWNESNEIEFSSDGDVTLRNFLNYRSTKLVVEHPNDNAQLLTKETFAGGVVGKALKGPICTYEFSGGVSMQHSQVLAVVATTMAHEMGHNFGMEHDSSDCHCPDEKCVMAASSTAVVPVHWSSCSIDQLTIAFSRGMNYCLRNKPTKLFESPQCGNGFVEPGEQCDCGLPTHCENSCCNAHTCMLHSNASCATGECCDLDTCRPKLPGSACRPSENECDLPEYCTGESEYCPADVFRRDTEPCDNNQAYCFQGTCRSHANQCRILWGPTGDNSVHCYEKNVEGSRLGNCGYNRHNKTFVKCSREHVHCGMLHCIHLNERLEFGMESAAVLSHSYVNHNRKIVACRTALVDLGLQTIDPGLTPNGAKCGEHSMCVNQQCLSVASVRQQGMGATCPDDCNDNGVCNSRGHCHCDVGFGGESCSKPGHGGSVDSGPATDPSSNLSISRFLYILFFLVLPLLFIGWLVYRFVLRDNKLFAGGKLAENIMKTANAIKQPTSRSNQNGGGPPGGAGGPNALPKSTPSSTDDMNSALLKSPSDSSDAAGGAANAPSMFGKFKGFTLRPLNNASSPASNYSGPNVAFVQPTVQLESNGVPQRSAPPPPVVKTPEQTAATKTKTSNTLPRAAPALPPPNPGCTARPIISKPTLDSSTLTMVPLKGSTGDLSPTRSAPAPPVPLHADPKLNMKRDGTIRRFASFLKKEDKTPLKEKTYIDRERLRTLEISAPMPVPMPPQAESSNSDSETTPREEETKNLVKRTQSMRSPTRKTQPQTFGSMRSPPGAARPKSIVTNSTTTNAAGGTRPKSPPPRPPPVIKKTLSTTSSGYQLPVATAQTTVENNYDDCEFIEKPLRASSDAIYSVIEEIPPAAQTLKRSDLVATTSSSTSSDMGLLGEIVNEFEKLNGGDSLYSGKPTTPEAASAAAPPPPEVVVEEQTATPRSPQRPAPPKPAGSNRNSSTEDKPPAVTPTYMRATTLNAPVARVAPTRSDISPSRAFSSFKPAPATSSSSNNSSSTTTTTTIKAAPTPAPAAQTTRIGGAARPKSFTRTSKTLPNGVAATPSATIQKPKPLSAKPSFSGGLAKRAPGAAASATVATAPTPPTVKASSNIASLTSRFEQRK
ncbi:disintegrin and metalloproteinase domain-containing protein 9 [Drosophila grimshawi]|uniref:disintegrin and metalloproteinase domain-containing protein 9 n=1 Tax=Drosophila grimshawi TaxID=7222 RepID=UPI001C934ABF|nr:disintegrin and metalloproteinase domain-containing protein 9 [Drosophila grimshawi]